MSRTERTKMGYKVISLFDGMSGGQIALKVAGVDVDVYYASEIKPHAIEQTMNNFPNTQQVGNVHFVNGENFKDCNLLIGGSPCQDFTSLKIGRKGLEGNKSWLFHEYVRVLKEVKPKYFLLENVASMKNADRDYISKTLGVEPIFINSSDFSAQQRRRYYWTNIPVDPWDDKGINLCDIVDYDAEREENFSEKKMAFVKKKISGTKYVRLDGEKSMPITARGYSAWNTQFVTGNNGEIRDLTVKEYRKLQTIPDWYKFNCIKSKATDLIGDGWTIDVVAHIFKNLK